MPHEEAELTALKEKADGLLYTTEKALEEYSVQVNEGDVARIESDLRVLRSSYNTDDVGKIRWALMKLERSSDLISQALGPGPIAYAARSVPPDVESL